MKRAYHYLYFSCVLVDLCQSCLDFTNHNVTFNATNFEYVLQWKKDHLPSDVSFSVQYKRYGQTGWSLFSECQNIPEIFCDLTNAITGDEEDFMEHQYFGRVRASLGNCSSDWVMSKRLNPRDDTFLILPKLNYIEHVSSVTILVLTPSLVLKSKDKKLMTVEELYRDQSFEYHLIFSNAEKHDIWQIPQKNSKFQLSGLSPNTKYNGSVYIMIGDKRKSNIQTFVVKTLPDHSLVTLIICLIAIFAVVLGTVMLYLSCKYVRSQAKTPTSLDFKKVTGIQLMTAKKEKCSSCTMGFSPSMFPLMNYLNLTQCQDQSGNAQPVAYASQFQTSTANKDSSLLSQASSNLLSVTDSSVHYGGLFEATNVEYQSNHTPSVLNKTSDNSQLEFQVTDHLPLLDGLQNNGDIFTLIFPLLNQNPNSNLDNMQPLELLLGVVVSDDSEFIGHGEFKETRQPILLSDVNISGLPNDQIENNALQNSLPENASSSYRLHHPVEDLQLSYTNRTFSTENASSSYRLQNQVDDLQQSFTNGTFIYEQPYRLQH